MHFIEYALIVICFELLYWYLIFTVVALPSLAFMGLVTWATGEQRTRAKKVLVAPILVGAFIFGTLVPVLFFSAGIFAVTNLFMQSASHPMLYAIIGGLFCFFIRAPSGEANFIGVVVSVFSYVLFMTILKEFGQNVSDFGDRVVQV